MLACHLVLAVWGFVAGFVGWVSCVRLVAPVADWLLEGRTGSALAVGAARLVVAVFGLLAMGLILGLPLAIAPAEGCRTGPREGFGVAFSSSLAGLVAYGVLRRLASCPRRRR